VARSDIRWAYQPSTWSGQTEAEAPMPDARCFRLTGFNSGSFPAAGSDVDGVTVIRNSSGAKPPVSFYLIPASPGWVVQVESAASFSNGVPLETLADGRVQAVGSGKAVLRALESSSGAGSLVWAVFTSGR
jgi:hypothetical protein